MPKCLEYLDKAQVVLTESPVEVGQWSRAAAWPPELKDKLASEVNKVSGWPAVRRRVKQLWSKGRQHRSSHQQSHSSAPSTSSISPPAPVDVTVAVDKGKNTRLPLEESLPFFALACSLFAVGADPAKDSEPENRESAPYLLALGQQALSIWIDGGERLPERSTETVAIDEMVKEARADYFRANSVAVQYYLAKGSSSGKAVRSRPGVITFCHPNKRQLLTLVRCSIHS